MRYKEKILYYSKALNQNAAKMMLEMRRGTQAALSMLPYLAISGASQQAAMVFVICLHSCRYEQPTPSTYRLLANGYFKLTGTSEEFDCGTYLTAELFGRMFTFA